MSSTLVGPADIAGGLVSSVVALGGAAVAATCVASGAAIGATIGLPLYGAYKIGDFTYNTCEQIITSRIANREYESKRKATARSQRPQLIHNIKQLQFKCKSEPDLCSLLTSMEEQLSDDIEHTDSALLFATNQICKDLLSNIDLEFEKRQNMQMCSTKQDEIMREFRKKLTTLDILPETHFSWHYSEYTVNELDMAALYKAVKDIASNGATYAIQNRAKKILVSNLKISEARAIILENALTSFEIKKEKERKKELYDIYQELAKYVSSPQQSINSFTTIDNLETEIKTLTDQAEEKIQHTIIFAKLLRNAEKNISDKDEATNIAKQSYIKLAFETELRKLNMVSSEPCQELIDTLTNQKIRRYKSGTQTLKETTLADGTRVIELITPRNISEATRKAIQIQQQQRCKQYRILQENLKKKWDVLWDPTIVTDETRILHSKDTVSNSSSEDKRANGTYFNTNNHDSKDERQNKYVHYQEE